MGPFSHTYISTKVAGRKSSLLIFGSVLPDIAWLPGMNEWRRKLHNNPNNFYNYIHTTFPKYLDLALGVKLHCYKGKGADYYSDHEKTGFAKIEAPKLSNDVANLLELELKGVEIPVYGSISFHSNAWFCKIFGVNRFIALRVAHNFIEAGVDLNLMHSHKEIPLSYVNTFQHLDLQALSHCFSLYLGKEIAYVRRDLDSYMSFLNPKGGFTSAESLATNIVIPLLESVLHRSVKNEDTVRLLNKAQKITQDSYKVFLDRCVVKMKSSFHEFI